MYKILVVGDFLAPIHEIAISNALRNNGHNVDEFRYYNYLDNKGYFNRKFSNAQILFRFGPSVLSINNDLKEKIKHNSYDFVFFYRPVFIKSSTLAFIKKYTKVFFYNNDDPFSLKYKFNFWKDYKIGVSYCDHVFYHRKKNMDDLLMLGCKSISEFRSYFIKELNYPITTLPNQKYKSDISFIGHYEDDGRDEILKFLLDLGMDLKIYGPEWKRSKLYSYFEKKMGPIFQLTSDYNLAINSTKIALVFLSKLNNDTYTRRCFEIPATSTFMLSEYTSDMADLFQEGIDAEFFRDRNELVQKINYYLENDHLRNSIANSGFEKVFHSGHEVNCRVNLIIDAFESIKNKL